MNMLQTLLAFLTGTYAKFGTTRNLLREITLSIMTAVVVAVIVQLLTPPAPSPVLEVRDLVREAVQAQRRADEALAKVREWQYGHQIDSLKAIIEDHEEIDSMRANARLSNLGAMQQVNRAIQRARQQAAGRNAPPARR